MVEKVGEFFIRMGIMRQEDVENVLRRQQAGDKSTFGVIALKLGYIGEDAIKKYVSHLEKELQKSKASTPSL